MKKFAIFAVTSVFVLLALLTVCGFLFNETNIPLPSSAKADLIVIEKAAHKMTLFEKGQPLRSYTISLGRGGLAPKEREGDNLTPEGKYEISDRNENSAYHLSLRISYPDSADIAKAQKKKVSPGSDIMIHGIRNGLGWLGAMHRYADWTAGCIAVTNQEIAEIWQAVPDGAVVDIRP